MIRGVEVNRMRLPQNKYSLESFIATCNEFIKKSNKNLQILTLLFRSENEADLFKMFTSSGYTINAELGKVIELNITYNLYKMERQVYYYLFQHPKYEEIYFIFSFNGIGDIYRTLPSVLDPFPNLYYLWLPPTYFDKLKEKILKIKGAYVTYFHGKKLDTNKQECKRPMFSRDIKYKGDDAKSAMEELRFEYGVLPQTIEFVIPDVSRFKINKNGYYTLFNGDLDAFLENVVDVLIQMVIKDNKEMADAKYSITRKGELEVLSSREVKFELVQSIGFEEFEEFISVMQKSDFSPYNIRLAEGSVIFSANVVDEKKGNIFAVTSNGKQFTIIPKYNSSFVSIIRFHRFLVEKIDQLTSIVHNSSV
jgi:hypothetical protein